MSKGGDIVGKRSGKEGREKGPLVLEVFGANGYDLFQVRC